MTGTPRQLGHLAGQAQVDERWAADEVFADASWPTC